MGVEGGKGKLVYDIMGCGRLVVIESYNGVSGGSSVGGAGSLIAATVALDDGWKQWQYSPYTPNVVP